MAAASRPFEALRQRLIDRRTDLTGEVEDGARRRLEENQFANARTEVGDPGDASTATEQAGLRNSQIERDVAELRAIDAALARLEDGTYGTCTRCGGDVGTARLRANPAAERCIACQTAFEKQFAGSGTPSL